MAKIEKEIKILDIDVDIIKDRLENIGAEYKGKTTQKIYVYDIPTIYYRYLEIKELLKINNEILINTNKIKLKVLLNEFNDLITDENLNKILKEYNLKNILDILNRSILEINEFLDNDYVENLFKKLKINPNKWIRLRQSNDKILLTNKHILEKEETKFQKVLETEIEVSSLEETNLFLESVGIVSRSYQEKIRYSYVYKDAEIEIDIWPIINPYLEIECDNDHLIEEIVNKLDLKDKEIVSFNTEQLYKRIGIDVHSISELRFNKD